MANGNGNRVVAWLGGGAALLRIVTVIVVVTGTFVSMKVTLASLEKSVEKQEELNQRTHDILKKEGCNPSQENREDIIRMQSDIKYIVEGVKRIEQKVQ